MSLPDRELRTCDAVLEVVVAPSGCEDRNNGRSDMKLPTGSENRWALRLPELRAGLLNIHPAWQQASARKDGEMTGLELSVHASIKGLLITDLQQVFIMCFCICQVQAASTHFR